MTNEHMILSQINSKYDIWLTPDRDEFHAKRPDWEGERLADCHETMTEGMTVWDIGAECGDFTALYHLWVGPTGTVIPIEPSPPYYPAIRAHWEANNLPKLKAYFPGFVFDKDQLEPPMRDATYSHTFPAPDGWPYCSVGEVIPDFGFRHAAQQTHHTPTLTIDTLVTHLGSVPDVIVMDIEGAECHALEGARNTLKSIRPILYVSIHQPTMLDWYERRIGDIMDLMSEHNYSAELLGMDAEEHHVFRPL